MINITVQGKKLTLKLDTVIKLELVFPDPTQDNLPNSFVQWFNIPGIIENDEIFNFVKYIEISDKIRIYENTVLEASGISKKGKLIVKSATNGDYKIAITFNPFSEGFKDTLLQELDLATYGLGSDTDAIIATAKAYSQLTYPNTDMAFPMIKMGNFYGADINEVFQSFINNYNQTTAAYIKNIELSTGNGNINCLVPHFYLLSALEAIFSEIDYDVSGNFLEDADIMKLILFNNYAIDKLREDYIVRAWTNTTKNITIPPYVAGPIPILTDDEVDADNCWLTFEYEIKAAGYHTIDISGEILSLAYVGDVATAYIDMVFTSTGITDLQKTVNVSTSGIFYNFSANFNFLAASSDIGTKIQFKTSVIAQDLDPPSMTYIGYSYKNINIFINPYSYNNKNVFESTVSMQNHLPNISVSEFVNNLVKLYSLAVFTNEENKIEFSFWKDILENNNLLDLTDCYIKDSDEVEVYKNIYKLQMPFSDSEIDKRGIDIYTIIGETTRADMPFATESNQVYYLKDLNRWIISYFDFDNSALTWKPYRDNFEDINPNDSSATIIEIKVNTLQMHLYGYPVSDLAGTSPEFGLGKTDFPFKLLFYYGIIENYQQLAGYQIPYASSNKYEPDGTSGANHSLRLNDSDGIYEKYSKEYYEYAEETDINTVDLNINDKVLADIIKLFTAGSDTRKIRIVNRNYLPVKIDVEIGMNGIKSCKAKLR